MAVGTTPSERLADFVLSLRYENLPAPVVEKTRHLLLDWLGVACGGRVLADSSGPILESVRELWAGELGPATVIGEHRTFPPHYAALLNGAFAHSLDFDDTHLASHSHPGAPIFATLLALGEASHASGREFIAAVVAAYEIFGRIGAAHDYELHKRGFHPTATTGVFGATGGGARLLGLTREVLLNAWGINLSQAAGTLQYLENGAWTKRVQTGLAAHNALIALTLARHGVLGSADPFEGRFGYYRSYVGVPCNLSAAMKSLGEEFEIMGTGIKPYPCCRCNHPIIDGVLALAAEHRLAADDVVEMEFGMSHACLIQVAEPEDTRKTPQNIVDGQFSVFFTAAMALLEGRFGWDSYRRLQDPAVVQLMARMRSREAAPPVVAITTRRGEKLVREVPSPKGNPDSFPTWEELLAKAGPLARAALPETQVERLVREVSRLEELADVGDLTRHLRPC